MAKTLTFYFPLEVTELEALVDAFQKEFDELLKDNFSDEELASFERQLDGLAAVFVSPLSEELSFQELDAAPIYKDLFLRCKSVLLLENVPYLENNPFQVSWLSLFLNRFSDFLVEPGNFAEVTVKEDYVSQLSRLKDMDQLLRAETPPAPPIRHGVRAPVLPIDFLILDVYREIDRLREEGKLTPALEHISQWDKPRRLFMIMKEGKLDANSLLELSGLIPKDFDDNLEKLKFALRKV